MTFWKSPSFKTLQRAWYQRLEEEGFQDAEELIGGELMLRQIASHAYRDMGEIEISTKESYYRLLGRSVQVESFQNDVDRLILTMFAEGAKLKHIGEALEQNGKGRCRNTIRFTIRKYEMRWGLREYTPSQLNRKG